jgi:hypothetical protein
MSQREWISAVVVGLVLTALFWVDALFIVLALLGPLVIGAVAARRNLPIVWPITAVTVAGLGAVVSDWVINGEDVAFHLALTVVMVVLATAGWWVAARGVRARPA